MKSTLLITIIAVLALMTGCQSGKFSANTVNRKKVEYAIGKVYPALVRIQVVSTVAGGGRLQRRMGVGSGTIMNKDGYILTNHHVAGRGTHITVRLSNNEELKAKLIGTDIMTDLAIIKIDLNDRKDKTPIDFPKFGDSDKMTVGDPVMALGSPAALSQSVTLGIVSNVGMMSPRAGTFKLDGEDVGILVRWIGHDAVIFGGNSGGPLINLKGEIIGINEVGIGSMGGAIPSNLAKDVAMDLIKYGRVRRSWTGWEVSPLLKSLKTDGVLVQNVLSPSPAKTAGIKAGDIITEFDGKKVSAHYREEMPIFNGIVLGTKVGKEVVVKVLRDGKPKTFKFKTVEREAVNGEDHELKTWGLTARDYTRIQMIFRKRKNRNGVMVYSIRSGGPVSQARPAIRPGDTIIKVDGQKVDSIGDLKKLTPKNRKSSVVYFERGGSQYVTVVKLNEPEDDHVTFTAVKAWLGASTQVMTKTLTKAMKLKIRGAVRITNIAKGSPAETAKLKVGDIITRIDGMVVQATREEDQGVFDNTIRQYAVGSEVVFEVYRDGKKQKIKCKLGKRSSNDINAKTWKENLFEFAVRGVKTKKGMDLKVSKVENAGWASLGGLRPGDKILTINSKKVNSLEDINKVMGDIVRKKEEYVVIFVQRGIRTAFVEILPIWEK